MKLVSVSVLSGYPIRDKSTPGVWHDSRAIAHTACADHVVRVSTAAVEQLQLRECGKCQSYLLKNRWRVSRTWPI